MKITSFNPLIVTSNAEPVVKLFEELGFEKRHSLDANTGSEPLTSIRMKNASGFHVDVSQVESIQRDITLIRMNVDDFDEAFAWLTERGFHMPPSGRIVETRTNKSCMMISPSGFAFDLCHHIKE